MELLSIGLTPSARCRFSRSSPLQQQEGRERRRQGICSLSAVASDGPEASRAALSPAKHTPSLPTCQLLLAAGLSPSLTCTPPPHRRCSLRQGNWSGRCRRAAPGSPCRQASGRVNSSGSSERREQRVSQSAATRCQPAKAPTPVEITPRQPHKKQRSTPSVDTRQGGRKGRQARGAGKKARRLTCRTPWPPPLPSHSSPGE